MDIGPLNNLDEIDSMPVKIGREILAREIVVLETNAVPELVISAEHIAGRKYGVCGDLPERFHHGVRGERKEVTGSSDGSLYGKTSRIQDHITRGNIDVRSNIKNESRAVTGSESFGRYRILRWVLKQERIVPAFVALVKIPDVFGFNVRARVKFDAERSFGAKPFLVPLFLAGLRFRDKRQEPNFFFKRGVKCEIKNFVAHI